MNKTAFPTTMLPTTAIISIMFHLTMVLTKRAIRKIISAICITYKWLDTQHDFYGQDGDPIKCTGWQFVGYNVIAAVVAILLCIEY